MLKEILVPDIGSYTNVAVIEIFVKLGDRLEIESGLIVLETDKATLEIPAPMAGIVKSVHLKVGDKVSQGSSILTLETEAPPVSEAPEPEAIYQAAPDSGQGDTRIAHAGPGVRQLARELGLDLHQITGTGPKGRILKEDLQRVEPSQGAADSASVNTSAASAVGGLSIAPWPTLDYSSFGPISRMPLSRIQQLSASYLHRNWVMVPHVTHFDEADITTLEAFRKEQQPLAERQGLKLTPVVFVIKALVTALQAFPRFNASFDPNRLELVIKKYYHMGVAVDTKGGLVVPVLRDVAHKGIFQLAKELSDLSQKARDGQLKSQDLQGNSFTVSSLGGIGGTAFTPIINVPDVAILGLSKAYMKPVYEDGVFKPKLYLPLSLSYDHRVIDGAEAARFSAFLVQQLSDLKRCLL